MATPRKFLIDESRRGYYHLTIRCVRRAKLCGYDDYTEKNYDYRKQWVKDRIQFLTLYFFVEVGAYAIMSNHMHLVVRNRPDLALEASDYEVVWRYLHVYTGVDARKEGRSVPTEEEIQNILADPNKVEDIRTKISSISWFMRALNEWLSKKANKEDGITGRFWESRFKSQYLATQSALLLCSAYVDLNPVRAFICSTPEEGEFTSYSDRIQAKTARERLQKIDEVKKSQGYLTVKQKTSFTAETLKSERSNWLGGFKDLHNEEDRPFYEISENDYLRIVDWAGKNIYKEGKGQIPKNVDDVFKRMKVANEQWAEGLKNFDSWFYFIVGAVDFGAEPFFGKGKKWYKGTHANERVFANPSD